MNDYSDRAATEAPRETNPPISEPSWMPTAPEQATGPEATAAMPVEPSVDELVAELMSTPFDPERRGKSTLYYRVAMYWHALGFNVIPGNLNKTPLVSFITYSGKTPEPLDPQQILEWAREWPDATPLLLPDSGHFGDRFTVSDADDPDMSPWIEDQYGVTPFVVTTGRDGGGSHHYYLTPSGKHVSGRNKIIGPDDGVITWAYEVEGRKIIKDPEWGKTAIDVKSKRNYVVAPGAMHRTGRIYVPEVDLEGLDLAWFGRNVPVFDVGLYDRHVRESAQRRLRKHRESRRGLLPAMATNEGEAPVALGEAVTGLEREPFFEWAEAEPGSVNLHTWWGMATNLVAAYGEAGRVEFHRLSALDSRYNQDETERTYDKVLGGGGAPSGYQNLQLNGYTGPVPTGCRSPADFILGQKVVVEDGEVLPEDLLDDEDDGVQGTGTDRDTPKPGEFSKAEWTRDEVERLRIASAGRATQREEFWREQVRKHLEKDCGLSANDCGFRQVLVNRGRGVGRLHHRHCGRRTCVRCVTERLSLKFAAIEFAAITDHGSGSEITDGHNATDLDPGPGLDICTDPIVEPEADPKPSARVGRPASAGPPMYHRESLWYWDLAADDFNSWKMAYKRATKSDPNSSSYEEGIVGGRIQVTYAHAYVRVAQEGGRVRVISTVPLERSRRWAELATKIPGTGITVLLAESIPQLPTEDAPTLAERFPQFELRMTERRKRAVAKNAVRSSQTLPLDPQTIWQKANPSPWSLAAARGRRVPDVAKLWRREGVLAGVDIRPGIDFAQTKPINDRVRLERVLRMADADVEHGPEALAEVETYTPEAVDAYLDGEADDLGEEVGTPLDEAAWLVRDQAPLSVLDRQRVYAPNVVLRAGKNIGMWPESMTVHDLRLETLGPKLRALIEEELIDGTGHVYSYSMSYERTA